MRGEAGDVTEFADPMASARGSAAITAIFRTHERESRHSSRRRIPTEAELIVVSKANDAFSVRVRRARPSSAAPSDTAKFNTTMIKARRTPCADCRCHVVDQTEFEATHAGALPFEADRHA